MKTSLRSKKQQQYRQTLRQLATPPGWLVHSFLAASLFLGASELRAQSISGGTVISGTATISTTAPGSTTITAGNNSILRWDSFNIATSERVQFVQPGADARVLNWIGSIAPTQIDGTLIANGQVYLVNPAGVYFGNSAVVDVGRLYAVGGSLSREDFLAGLNRFTSLSGDVRNAGTLRGDTVALLGRTVQNTGTIISANGFIALGAGNEVLLGNDGSSIYVDAGRSGSGTAAPGSTGVSNSGVIDAGRGTAVLAAGDMYSVAITHEGLLTARNARLQGQGGGSVLVGGSINASSTKAGETGGTIEVTGEKVAVLRTALLDASGAAGGGTLLVGGDFQGKNSAVRNASETLVQRGASLKADATVNGNGGKVVVWADGLTRFYGALSAQGGAQGGNGGNAEISGKQTLAFDGTVELRSVLGDAGSLLFDPLNIEIRASVPDLNGNGTSGDDVDSSGISSGQYPGLTSVITAGQVSSLLTSVGTLSLAATNNIDVLSAISWTYPSTDSALTLTAGGVINLQARIFGSGSPATLNLIGAVTANADGIIDTEIVNFGGAGDVGSLASRITTGSGTILWSKTSGNSYINSTYGDNVGIGGSTAGNIDFLGNGPLGQSSDLSVTGTSKFDVGANTIYLMNAGNSFTGAVSLYNTGTNDVAIKSASSVVLGTSVLGDGYFDVYSAGTSLTQVGAITKSGGESWFSMTGAGPVDILLHTQPNNFGGGAVYYTDGSEGYAPLRDVGFRNDNPVSNLLGLPLSVRNLDLYWGGSAITVFQQTVTGNLNVTAVGDISQSGTLTVGGASSFNSGAHNIFLDTAGNAFTGPVSITNSGATNVLVYNSGTLILGPSTFGTGTLNAISINGGIEQSGVLTKSGGDSLFGIGNGANVDILLGSFANDLGAGTVEFSVLGNGFIRDYSLRNDNAAALFAPSTGWVRHIDIYFPNAPIDIGNFSASGNVSVTAGGAITQFGDATVYGSSSFTTGAFNITLDADNYFGGPVSLHNTGTASATIRNFSELTFGNSTLGSGSLSVFVEDGGISQYVIPVSDSVPTAIPSTIIKSGGDISLQVSSSFGLEGGIPDVMLNSAGNNLGGGRLDIATVNGGVVRDIHIVNTHAAAKLSSLPATLRDLTLDFSNAPVDLPVVNATRDLSVNAGGAITQSGVLTIDGSAYFATLYFPITLSLANDFRGTAGGENYGNNDVVFTDINALTLGSSWFGSGLFTVNSVGVSQVDLVLQDPNATGAVFNAGLGDISLFLSNGFTGPVSLNNSGTANAALANSGSVVLGSSSLGSGTLDVTSYGGSITQTGAITKSGGASNFWLELDSGGSGPGPFAPGPQDILLHTHANDFGGGAVTYHVGYSVEFQDMGLRDDNSGASLGGLPTSARNIDIVFSHAPIVLPALTATGHLNITAAGGISQTDTLSVAGSSSFHAGSGAISLGAANTFTGPVSLSNLDNNDVVLTSSTALVLGDVAVGLGSLTVTAPGITQTGIVAQGFITPPLVPGSAPVQAAQATWAGPATFNSLSGPLTLSGANNLLGGISLVNTGSENVVLTNQGDIVLGDSQLGSGSLTVTSLGGGITQTGTITKAGGDSLFVLNGSVDKLIWLKNSSNNFGGGAVGFGLLNGASGLSVGLHDNNAGAHLGALPSTLNTLDLTFTATGIQLPALTLTGDLYVRANGAITQSGALSVADEALFDAYSGAITLTGANDFKGLTRLFTTGAVDVSINDINALHFGQSYFGSGSVLISAVGVSQVNNFVQSANAGSFTINAGAGAIDLQGSNMFTGTVILNNSGANNVALNAWGNIVLGTSSLGSGSLDLTTQGGSISQVGALTKAGGLSRFWFAPDVSVSTAPQDLLLSNAANNLGSGAISVGTLGGATVRDIYILSNNSSVALAALPATARNIDLIFANSALVLPALTATGHLNVTTGGALTQGGAAVVDGASSFIAGANAITLTQAANNFTGAVSLSNSGANNVAVTDLNGLVLGTSSLGSGTFTATAVGISQTGALTQATGAGAATFNAGAGSIALGLQNAFRGAVSLNNSGAYNVTLVNSGNLVLGASSLGSGTLDVTSRSGSISQTGALTKAGGSSRFWIDAGVESIPAPQDILLHTHANNFGGGSVSFGTVSTAVLRDIGLRDDNAAASLSGLPTSARNIDLVFSNSAIVLPALTATGHLNVTAGGAITQTGAATVSGSASFSAGANAITLTQANNDFSGPVSLSNSGANAVALTDRNALSLGAVIVGSGSLTVNAVGISQSGYVDQADGAGAAVFNAGAGSLILDSFNDFTGAVSLNNSGVNAVVLNNARALVLGTSSLGSGTLTVTSVGGGISQSGVITKLGGSSQFLVDTQVSVATPYDILLNTQANDFGSAPVGFGTLRGALIRDIGLRNVNAAASLGSFPATARNVDLVFNNTGVVLPALTLTGNLTVTASGAITQTGAATVAGSSSFSAGANALTLTQANDFTGAVSLSNSGANNVAITDVNGLVLGTSSVGSGTFTATAVGITQTGALSQAAGAGIATFNAGAGALTLTQLNQFTGVLSLNNSGANNVALRNSGNIVLGTLSLGSGTLDVTSVGGGISQGTQADHGVITKTGGRSTFILDGGTAKDIDLYLGLNDFGGGSVGVTLLNGSTLGTLALTDLNANAQLGALPSSLGTLSLSMGNAAVVLPSLSLSGQAWVQASSLTQTGALIVAGQAGFHVLSGPLTLTGGNDFQSSVHLTSLSSAALSLSDVNGLSLGDSLIGNGLVTLNSVGFTQVGDLVQYSGPGAALVINAGAGAIDMGRGAMLAGPVSLNNSGAHDVTLSVLGNVVLGTSSLGSGLLDVTAVGGSITQVGALTKASGLSRFKVGPGQTTEFGPQDVLLGSQANDLGAGAVSITALSGSAIRDVGLRNINAAASLGVFPSTARNVDLLFNSSAIALPALTVTGNLNVTAGGAITQAGAATVAGTASFSAGANAITLTHASNDFTGAVSLSNSGANNVSLTDVNAVILGTVTLGNGLFTVNAIGISQTGAVSQAYGPGERVLGDGGAVAQATGSGSAVFNAGTGAIDLTGSNSFTGTISLNNSGGANVALTNTGNTALATSSLGSGTLTVTSVGGGITQTGALTKAGGTASFRVDGGSNQDILLHTQANDFAGGVSFTTVNGGTIRDIGLRNDNSAATLGGLPTTARNLDLVLSNTAIALPTLTVTGNLNVTAGGAITQTGAATVTGTSSFRTGGFALTLTQANNFTGAVSLANSGANNVAITDINGLVIGTSSLGSGTLAVNAVGITQTGALTQAAGAGATSFNGGAGAIALDQANNFTGLLTLTNSGANNVSVLDINTLSLGSSSVGGNLAINAGGAISLGGTVAAGGYQSYNNAITLTGATTLTGTSLTLAGTLTGAGNDLTLGFSGGNPVDGAVLTGLRDLTANGGTTTLRGTVTTSRNQTYNTAAILGTDVTLNSSTGAISFGSTISGAGRALSIAATQGDITVVGDIGAPTARLASLSANGKNLIFGGDIWTEGNIVLGFGNANSESSNDSLRFNIDTTTARNTRVDSATGELIMGSGSAGSPAKTGVPLRSSIFKSNEGNLYLFARKITVQPFERLTVRNGSLVALADGTAATDGITLSNTAVSRFLVLATANTSAPSVTLRSRLPGDIILAEGTSIVKDNGTDLVAGSVLFFNKAFSGEMPTRTKFAPMSGSTPDSGSIDYLTNTGNVPTGSGAGYFSILPDSAGTVQSVYVADLMTFNVFRPVSPSLVYLDLATVPGFEAARNDFINPPKFGSVSEIPIRSINSTGAVFSSALFTPSIPSMTNELDILEKQRELALPGDENIIVLPEADLSAGVLEHLRALGIYARTMHPSERVSRDKRAGIFIAVPETTTPKISDYELANTRVADKAVREVIRLASEAGLFTENQERLEQVSRSLATSFESFSAVNQTGGAREFRTWLEARHDADATRVLEFLGNLRSTLARIELLGLTHQELEGSLAQIYGSILKSKLGTDPEFIRALVQDLPTTQPLASL